MNSIAVPSQPDVAALARSRVVRVAGPAFVLSVMTTSSPVVHGAVEAARDRQVAGFVGEAGGGLDVVLDAETGLLGRDEHPVGEPHAGAEDLERLRGVRHVL